jgi:RNA polymerase sigma factor (sigma-70 family)
VQETLFKAFRCQSPFHEGLLLSAWLYTIMRNEFIDEHARRRDVPISDIVGFDDVLVSLPAQHWVAFGRVVAKRIDCLPNNQRTALLAICGGASYQDAATEMGCELGTVKTWVSRARKTLSSEMGGIFDLPRFQ